MKKTALIIFFAFFYLLSACNQLAPNQSSENIRPVKMSTSEAQQRINQEEAETAKNLLLKKDEVKLVRAVQSSELLIAAVELEHWNTFQSKKLTKEMKKTLEKELKIKNIEVTTDHKIFIELEKLEEKLIKNDLSKKKLDKEMQKINKLMKEQT